ncbi:hypothetical protein P7K49_009207 [Saguinus oedipus]|uniref:Cystatin domain-containing protein n=1 Tax=Saguinus oedipus TaxID=9490 RepID=A0ABQ9VJY0_SAGOE|nr:hypothetical protein P7K49_009207 [Saguinus oedipus]
MAGPLRAPLLLLAVLAVVLAVSPAASASPGGQPHLLGGPLDASVEEEGVRRALDFAVSEYNKASNDRYHSRALQVVRARKQGPEPRAPRPSPPRASPPHPVPGLGRHPGALGGRVRGCPDPGLAWNRTGSPGPRPAPEICFPAPAGAARLSGGST